MGEELDVVALKVDFTELGLKAGDRGAIVALYGDTACEVEFVNADGPTRVMAAFDLSSLEVIWRIADQRGLPRSAAG